MFMTFILCNIMQKFANRHNISKTFKNSECRLIDLRSKFHFFAKNFFVKEALVTLNHNHNIYKKKTIIPGG